MFLTLMTDAETLQAALDALIKERDMGIIQAEELVRQRKVIGELGESVKALRHKVSASEDREVEARSAADGEVRALRRALESREAELLTLAQSQGTTPRDLAALKEEESAGGSSGERAIRAVKVRAMNTALAEQCGTLARERNLAKQYDIANPASLSLATIC